MSLIEFGKVHVKLKSADSHLRYLFCALPHTPRYPLCPHNFIQWLKKWREKQYRRLDLARGALRFVVVRGRVGVGKLGEGGQKVQDPICKKNNCRRCDVHHDGYC